MGAFNLQIDLPITIVNDFIPGVSIDWEPPSIFPEDTYFLGYGIQSYYFLYNFVSMLSTIGPLLILLTGIYGVSLILTKFISKVKLLKTISALISAQLMFDFPIRAFHELLLDLCISAFSNI